MVYDSKHGLNLRRWQAADCYVYAQRGEERAAITLCLSCGAILCVRHLAEQQSYSQGDMKYGSDHNLPQSLGTGAVTGVPSNGGYGPSCTNTACCGVYGGMSITGLSYKRTPVRLSPQEERNA